MYYISKHGSRLNIMEREFSALAMRRPGNRCIWLLGELNDTISHWEKNCNKKQIEVKWHFTVEGERIKLKHYIQNYYLTNKKMPFYCGIVPCFDIVLDLTRYWK